MAAFAHMSFLKQIKHLSFNTFVFISSTSVTLKHLEG